MDGPHLSGRDVELLLRFRLALLHARPEVLELLTVEDLASLLEHLAFLFSMWCSTFSCMTLALAPALILDRQAFELGHHGVDNVVLLVAFEDDLLSPRVVLQCRVEDLLR